MLAWAAQNAVVTLVLAVVVAVVCRIGRLGPASRHALWLVVLIKLVTPPLVAWPWAVPIPASSVVDRGGFDSADAASSVRRDFVVSSETITLSAPVAAETASPVRTRSERRPPVPADPAISPAWSAAAEVNWALLAYIVWFAGALAVAGLYSVRILRMHRLAARATPAPQWLAQEVAAAAALVRIRPPRVAVAAELTTPLVWSLGRATLLWPAGLAESERPDAWRGVILHELAHLRRRDQWTGWLELVAGVVWWFHPVYWYARHQVRENAELACDAWVVRLLPEGRRSYAEALLSVCEFGSPAVSPPAPALGVHSGARRVFERRLTMILRERLPVRVSRGAWIAAVLLAAVAVPNWYLVARAQPAAEDDAREAEPDGAAAPTYRPSAADVDLAAPESESGIVPLPTQQSVEEAFAEVPTPQPALPRSSFLLQDVRPQPARSVLDRLDERAKSGYQHVVNSDSFTLSRTTYLVPTKDMAERVRGFLEQNLSWPHLLRVEVKQGGKDDQFPPGAKLLIVTASPKAQEVIDGLIGLMIESKPHDPVTGRPEASDPFGGAGSGGSDPFGSADEGDDGSDPFGSAGAADEDPFRHGSNPFASTPPRP